MIDKAIKFLKNNFILFFILYYFTLFLDTTSLEIDYPIIETISKILRYVAYFLFFIRLICILPEYKKDIFGKKWKDNSFIVKCIYIVIIIMIVSLVINFLTTGNRRLIFLIFVLITCYKTDYNKIIKTTMNLQIMLTSILVLFSIMGVTQNYVIKRSGQGARNSLGFLYPTNLSQMIVFSSILYLYERKGNVNIKKLFFIQLLNSFTYFITDSRTEFIMLETIIIIMLIYKIFIKMQKTQILEKVKKIYSYIFLRIFVFLPIVSLIVVMCYSLGGVWNKLNNMLSNRLKQTYDNIIEYNLHPFGEDVDFIGLGLREKIEYGKYESNFVDNEYIHMMFNEGYVFAIGFILIINLLLIMLYERQRYKEIILCSIYLAFGVLNPRIVNILYCPILFMIIPIISEYKNNYIKNKIIDIS